ncbi:MAG TPA: HAMP domain-containing sensor histidine kinase [Nitriliruptorales bacterium]
MTDQHAPGAAGDDDASASPAPALLLTADDEVYADVAAALAHDGQVRSLRRARTLGSARNALPGSLAVLADPRVQDATVGQVAAWLRTLVEPVLVLVPAAAADRCLPAVHRDLAHHVLTPGAPGELLAVALGRLLDQQREERGTVVRDEGLRDRLAVVRHEMATPLTAIEGFLEGLIAYGERMSPQRRRESLEATHRNAGRLRRLVAELNALVKSAGAGGDTSTHLSELRPLVVRLVEDLGPRSERVEVHVPEGLQARVDDDHITAILSNLIDNATKYGQPPIEVRAATRGAIIEVAVVDHGAGVPDEFVPRMFQRYARAREAVRAGQPGSGIGLNLCLQLAQAMGGTLRYETGADGGSVFVLELVGAGQPEGGRPDEGDEVIDLATSEESRPAQTTPLAPAEGVPSSGHGRRRPVAGDLEVVRDGLRAYTTVGLEIGDRRVEGRATGAMTLDAGARAVVRATLDAVEVCVEGAARFDVEGVRLEGSGDNEHVTVTITVVTAEGFERLVGSALIRSDPQRAAMHATLDALNRRIERLLV